MFPKKKFAWSNVKSFEDAQFVLFGIPDEKGSHSYRGGAAAAPDRIRKISVQRGVFERKEKTLAQPMNKALDKRIFDAGNIHRNQVSEKIAYTVSAGKTPVSIGGDHSLTSHILQGIAKAHKKGKIALIYLDAHPDIICSERNYYGSVVCDMRSLGVIDMKKSYLLGMREPEPEEFGNILRVGINAMSAYEVFDSGIKKAFQNIKKKIGNLPVYLSIDMDVLDPAFAPGVSTPSPGGLSSMELIYLAKRIAGELNLVAFDVMEVNPKYDSNDRTSHLAAKLIIETISSRR